jgi:hypothetical protein
MSLILHDPELCGLDLDGRPLCGACKREAQAESLRNYAIAERRRRRDVARSAVSPIVRRWLYSVIRRHVRDIMLAELPEAHEYLHAHMKGSRHAEF